MARPCECDRVNCRLCNLYKTETKFRDYCDNNDCSELKNQPPPSLLQRMKNLGTAIKEQVQANFPATKDIETKRRLDICGKCPFFENGYKCKVWGCNMQVKATWATQKCPKGFWESSATINNMEQPNG